MLGHGVVGGVPVRVVDARYRQVTDMEDRPTERDGPWLRGGVGPRFAGLLPGHPGLLSPARAPAGPGRRVVWSALLRLLLAGRGDADGLESEGTALCLP